MQYILGKIDKCKYGSQWYNSANWMKKGILWSANKVGLKTAVQCQYNDKCIKNNTKSWISAKCTVQKKLSI